MSVPCHRSFMLILVAFANACLGLCRADSPVERTPEPVAADGPTISIAGVVTTPVGQPIAGASVFLRAKIGGQQYTFGLRHNRDLLAKTRTSADGRFVFEKVGIPPRLEDQIQQLMRGEAGAELIAWAEGCGMAWSNITMLQSDQPTRVVLNPEAEMTGVVKDSAGRPISGVRLTVYGLSRTTANVDPLFNGPGSLNLNLSELPLGATSDAEGRFTISHLPKGCRVAALCEGDGHRRLPLMLETGDDPSLKEIRYEGREAKPQPLLRSPLVLVLEPQRHIAIRIVDHAGQPVSGGAVQVLDDAYRDAGWVAVDQHGTASIGFDRPARLTFIYGADPLERRLGSSVTAEVSAGAAAPRIEIRLPKPRWLTGRVLDADTGEPVVGVYLRYRHVLSDESPEFTASSGGVSMPNGQFRLPVATGRGVVMFPHAVHGYLPPTYSHAVERTKTPFHPIQVPAEGEIAPLTLKLARGLGVRGVVRDEEGKPVAGAPVRGANVDRHYLRGFTTTDADGKFTLSGLSPHADAMIIVASESGAAVHTIPGEPDHPWDKTRWVAAELTLAPGVALTGRVLKDGKPRSGVRMKISRSIGEEKNPLHPWAEVLTNAEGKYRVAGLAAGDRYWVEVQDSQGLMALDWQYQFPHIQTVPSDKAIVELPDAILVSRSQR